MLTTMTQNIMAPHTYIITSHSLTTHTYSITSRSLRHFGGFVFAACATGANNETGAINES